MDKKTVAIVGCAPSNKETPFHLVEDGLEIWSVNNAFISFNELGWPFTRWFEIHHLVEKNGVYYRRGSPDFKGMPVNTYMQELGKLNVPIYMQQKWDIIPSSIEYPVNEVIQQFGSYFTNSVSYMIAFAIKEKFEKILIYGVDMASLVGGEYTHQRASCEFFIGLAMGLGIEIEIPNTADLLKTRFLYGFEEPKTQAWNQKLTATLHQLEKKKGMAINEEVMIRDKKNQLIGAAQMLRDIDMIWSNPK